MRRAIREHLRDAVAIASLLVIGVAVAVAILAEQRAALPGWIPLLGEERVELRVELESAQAVTPGQGQTVNLSGVEIGDVSGVELDRGVAVVTVEIAEEYAPMIRSDASVLLRPRTGLQDMTLEVDPGERGEPISDGDVIPLAQTRPNVQVDEILASLDADTRSYLTLLLAGGAEGLRGRGEQAASALRRFEPTARDIARINGTLAQRRRNLERVVHNLRLLAAELARDEASLAGFISSSDAALAAFARQERALRGALRELPGALAETRGALAAGDRLALRLEPALRELIPVATELGPALREVRPFLRRTVEPIREQIRPFTRRVREPVRTLSGAADALERSSGPLARSLGDLNSLANALAFNPAGPREGYLFWLAWFNHNTSSLFGAQDARGPLRRGMVLLSCQTAGLAEGVAATRPFLLTLQQLSGIPAQAEIDAAGGCGF